MMLVVTKSQRDLLFSILRRKRFLLEGVNRSETLRIVVHPVRQSGSSVVRE